MMNDTAVTMLDVGQGQCIILRSQGRTFLIDCGGDSDEAAADLAADTLLAQGISGLDGIVVTHYDRDHAGGVGYLLQRVPADAIFLPDSPDEDRILKTILPYTNGCEVYVGQDLKITWGDCDMTVFAPILSNSDNERGLCVLFRGLKCDILITGDLSGLGEKLLLKEKDIPRVTVLVAGHHGAASSTSELLLSYTEPDTVLISVGADNSYGHPDGTVLARLERYGCEVRRTDLEGTIVIRR
jgi:competence protein ComEC